MTLLAFASLAAWIYLTFARRGFWLASERLASHWRRAVPAAGWPAVATVTPARDEATSVGETVRRLVGSDYPGPLTVTVVDDASSDGTAEIARAAAAAVGAAGVAFDVVAAPARPDGWSGKLNALAAGVAHAEGRAHAHSNTRRGGAPTYLLFVDADIALAPDAVRALVAKAEAEGLALASLMARLDARGLWGRLLIPAFVYFFQKLYPFPASNDPASPVAAAAGGCVLVRADALKAEGGIAAIRGELIDDCALAALIKRGGGGRRIWLGLADDEAVSQRDNRKLASVWTMVARTAFAQLGRSWPALAGATLGMLIVYAAPPLCFVLGLQNANAFAAGFGAAAWGLMATTYAPTATLYRAGPLAILALPIAGALYAAMTVWSGVEHARGRGGRWKGRTHAGELGSPPTG